MSTLGTWRQRSAGCGAALKSGSQTRRRRLMPRTPTPSSTETRRHCTEIKRNGSAPAQEEGPRTGRGSLQASRDRLMASLFRRQASSARRQVEKPVTSHLAAPTPGARLPPRSPLRPWTHTKGSPVSWPPGP